MTERDVLDEDIWGPMPTRLQVLRARFWNWRVRLWATVIRNTVCRFKGHRWEFAQPSEAYWDGVWYCQRCRSQRGARRQP